MAENPDSPRNSADSTASLAPHLIAAHRRLADALGEEPEHGGDSPVDAAALDEAAHFALQAAMNRPGRRPAIHMETVGGSARERHMRVAIINDDRPFLVDSIAATFAAQGLAIQRILHPVLPVRRDAQGQLVDILDADASGEQRESIIYLETARADARTRRTLESALEAMLADVQAAVEDWPQMQARMAADADTLPDPEAAALLRWFRDGALTLLGHVVRRRDGGDIDPLGVCRSTPESMMIAASFDKAFAWFDDGHAAPLIVKSNRLSTVHRRVPMDLIIMPVREGGAIVALSVHAGVWTSAALASPPEKVPVLRAHLQALIDAHGFNPSGHAGKALAHALTALPHDLLVAFRRQDLERLAFAAMSLADRPRPRLAMVRSALGRHLFVFAWLPRDELSTARRKEIEALLTSSANARTMSWSITMEGSDVALIRFLLDLRDGGIEPDHGMLDRQYQTLVRGWPVEVEAALGESEEESRAAALAHRYADAFPQFYRSFYGPQEAARDIARLRDLAEDRMGVRLYRKASDAGDQLRLKLYKTGAPIPLSDAVPMLENFGFRVLEEIQTPLADGALGYIHDFFLSESETASAADMLARADAIEAAIAAVLNGGAENDLFNRLIVSAGLEARAVVWIRAWYRYLRQTGISYGVATAVDALGDHPAIAGAIISLFRARHEPAFVGDRDGTVKAAQADIQTGLASVSAIDDDRLLRLFQAVVDAMLRTNAFAPAAREALAFKIDSALVPGLPKPLPWREIFVYSPQVEGIHLRAGPVARGGLRWSDRRDDFRTEILGLMKAQRVKNAVIVPTGAKGGFYPKRLPDPATDREGWLAEGKSAYQAFIRTLLSITDNIVDGKVVHPANVRPLDGEDPYFVVAADKGTASFSDVANAIAIERGFWLGDAFASGGSNGYDHKAMGITAKGAWISVQRHFAEMGVDVQSQPVNVVGCGDMSGDVFGNGMLLSKAIRLTAAFDHRHIFFDPDPEPATSWTERARLFALPRSSWDDYDKALISKGGGVFPRSQKSIALTPEIKALLGVDDDAMDPSSLIAAILRAPADLIWFGGIGTYVKAAAENNINVGDPANDAHRVNAEDLRARVIGEGANLGVTQAARIAFAGHGGRINTDFIDNSAGVDCSDNEVNIKIALNSAVKAGALDEAGRNALLPDMTDAVADLVLADNRAQALALSIAERGGADSVPSFVHLIEGFEERGRLDRKVEGLAGNEELQRRMAEGRGLTRPELAVLLSTAKLTLQDSIEHGALIADPGLADDLMAAFPPQMQARFADAILSHQLRPQIIATKLANRMVNRLGIIHPFELAEEEGASLAHVAMAFVAVEDLLGMPAIWHAIDATPMDEQARLLLYERAALAVRSQMADMIRASQDGDLPSDLVSMLRDNVARLSDQAKQLLNAEAQKQSARMAAELTAAGASTVEAASICQLYELDGVIGLARLAAVSAQDAADVTRLFSDLGHRLGLDWAQLAAARLTPSDPWERLLAAGLARDFQQMRLDFLGRAGKGDSAAMVEAWTNANGPRIAQFRHMVARAQAAAQTSVAMLAQLAGQARNLLGR